MHLLLARSHYSINAAAHTPHSQARDHYTHGAAVRRQQQQGADNTSTDGNQTAWEADLLEHALGPAMLQRVASVVLSRRTALAAGSSEQRVVLQGASGLPVQQQQHNDEGEGVAVTHATENRDAHNHCEAQRDSGTAQQPPGSTAGDADLAVPLQQPLLSLLSSQQPPAEQQQSDAQQSDAQQPTDQPSEAQQQPTDQQPIEQPTEQQSDAQRPPTDEQEEPPDLSATAPDPSKPPPAVPLIKFSPSTSTHDRAHSTKPASATTKKQGSSISAVPQEAAHSQQQTNDEPAMQAAHTQQQQTNEEQAATHQPATQHAQQLQALLDPALAKAMLPDYDHSMPDYLTRLKHYLARCVGVLQARCLRSQGCIFTHFEASFRTAVLLRSEAIKNL